MHKGYLGFLLILMMFGHNFVLNQTQSMQKPLTDIHSITITQFNLLYSIPSAVAILFIIPMGFFYDKYQNVLLAAGAITLSLGQALVTFFASQARPFFYTLTMTGRVLQGVAAQILYMIQGQMASSWMGRYAGVVFILPQVGQILNVMVTPWTYQHWGMWQSFGLGLITCLISTIACYLVYRGLKKHNFKKSASKQINMAEINTLSGRIGQSSQSNQKQSKNQFMIQQQHEPSSKSDDNNGELIVIPKLTQQQEIALPQQPRTVFQAGSVFWLVILLCGINQCLYFPFLDNANQLIMNRFCIKYEHTGYYLSIPFLAAMATSAISSVVLTKFQRKKLIFLVSFIPLLGHSLIFFDTNCQGVPSNMAKLTLILGLCFFGMGIGSYYSVSFPAVGLAIPKDIRGMGYACMGFVQTISMTLIPIISGQIIQSQQKIHTLSDGYKQSSLLFVGICLAGVVVSLLIFRMANDSSFMYDDQDQMAQQQSEVKSDEGKELAPTQEV